MKQIKILYFLCLALACIAPSAFGETPKEPATATAPDPIVGRWKMGKTIMVVRENGTMVSSSPNYQEKGKWELVGTEYVFNWSDGRRIAKFVLAPNGEKLQRRNKHNELIVVGEKIHD